MKTIKLIMTVITITALTTCMFGCQDEQVIQPQPKKAAAPIQKTPEIKPPTPAPTETAGTPKIQVNKPVHDFGRIGPNDKQRIALEFKNVGNGILKITKIKSTCGCTVPQLAKKEYAPGESGTINVTYSPLKKPGAAKKNLYIMSNDPATPQFQLALKSFIEFKVSANPRSLKLSLNAENSGIVPITVASKDNSAFTITAVRSTNNCITADIDPTHKSAKHVIKPKVDVQKLKKRLNGTITIATTHPDAKSLTVTYTALPMFSLSRPTFNIMNAEPGKPVIKDVLITSNYGVPFEIESITVTKDIMQVVSQEKQANGINLKVKVTPPAVEGRKRFFTDSMKIKIKDGDELTVRCSGWHNKKFLQ